MTFIFVMFLDDVGFSRADLECILKNDPAHKACREELRQLKDEFECYKAKAQIMRKSRLESETDTNTKDTEKLKDKIKNLKTTVESLHRDLEDKESELDSLQEMLASEKVNLQKLHHSELENERTVYAAKMQELEKQMQNQRSRTMLLINEKDSEIERLKKKVVVDYSGSSSTHRMNAAMLSRTPSSDDTVNELLLQSTPVRNITTYLIYFFYFPACMLSSKVYFEQAWIFGIILLIYRLHDIISTIIFKSS